MVGFHWFSLNNDENQWGPSLVMMRECPCSTKTREGLENPSPPPSRFPLAMGFAPLDPRDFPRASPSGNPLGLGVQNPWPREISQDFPRPSRFPSGFALGKSLGSREILGVGDGFSNPSLLLVEHGYMWEFEIVTDTMKNLWRFGLNSTDSLLQFPIFLAKIIPNTNKLASLEATLVWNYNGPSHWRGWSV